MRKISNISAWLLSIAAMLGICFAVNSCKPEGLIDESEFSLYYPGISDIGPSTTINVTPTWHGAQPNGFEIYNVTHEGKVFTEGVESFLIDPATGVVTLSNTEGLPIGKYLLSISCNSNGKKYRFADAIRVNMMKPIPDGIKVEPPVLEVKLADIIENKNLPTAQIITEGTHISIKSYLLAGIRRDGKSINNGKDCFKISKDGRFSIIGGNKDFIPGVYEIDFKLTTLIVGKNSEEGIFEKALTVNVTSEPLSITYEPAHGKVEAGFAYTSPAPSFIGSFKGLKYAIKEVTPACPELSIDEATGVLSFKKGNTLNIGDSYTVSLTVTNDFGSKDFDKAYSFEVVKFIKPIEKLVYENVDNIIQTCSFTNEVKEVTGDDIVYSFKNLPEGLNALEIDPATGKVTAPKHNDFPIGKHTITVLAKNSKNELETSFTVNILKNPYMFHMVSWGNNLGLEPVSRYASQHRIEKNQELTLPIKESDIPKGQPVKFEMDPVYVKDKASVSMNEEGTITVKFDGGRNVNAVIVTITVGEGEAAVVRKVPVFFNNIFIVKGADHYVEYRPFALCINPLKGGKGAPALVYDKDRKEIGTANLSIDFRRAFNYFNINGPQSHKDGQPKDKGFLWEVWAQYFNSDAPNTGARAPMSYNDNKANLSKAAAYLSIEDGTLIVNPNKFIDRNGIPANGLFAAQATFVMTGKTDPGKGAQVFPIMVWFDTKFE